MRILSVKSQCGKEKTGEAPKFDNFDQSLFQIAQLFLQNTKMQVEIPKLQFTQSDTNEDRTLRICQLIALLLAHGRDGSEVTAVTLYFDSKSDPPCFQFVFAKNKEPISPHDIERAEKLAKVIKTGASKPCNEFVTDICNYMALHSAQIQIYLGKYILKTAPTLVTQLDRMINSPEPQDWQLDFIKKNEADKIIAAFAEKLGIKPLEGLLSMMTVLINIANRCQSDALSGRDLATLGKYSHIIRESTLFLRFVDRIPGVLSQGIAMELWESLRILEVFHTSSVLLWEKLSDEKCKAALPYLEIIAATLFRPSIFRGLERTTSSQPARARLSLMPPLDQIRLCQWGTFGTFLQVRAKKTGKPLHGLRHDWLKKYPRLLTWDGTSTSTQTIHCEVKLALDCLNRRRQGKVVIGVSKQPCFCCESWFDAVNAKAKKIRFILAAGHKKVYPGWSPSGIEDGDKKVIARVWEMVDGVVDEVRRIEDKDLVTALPLKSKEIDFEGVEIDRIGVCDFSHEH